MLSGIAFRLDFMVAHDLPEGAALAVAVFFAMTLIS
jgi:hypothetical protein